MLFGATAWMSRDVWFSNTDQVATGTSAETSSRPPSPGAANSTGAADVLKNKLAHQIEHEAKRLAELKSEAEAMEQRRRDAEEDLLELRAVSPRKWPPNV